MWVVGVIWPNVLKSLELSPIICLDVRFTSTKGKISGHGGWFGTTVGN